MRRARRLPRCERGGGRPGPRRPETRSRGPWARGEKEVGEDDGGVDAQLFGSRDGDLGGQSAAADLHQRVVLADVADLRHVAAGLAQKPDWSHVDRFTNTGSKEPLRACHRTLAWTVAARVIVRHRGTRLLTGPGIGIATRDRIGSAGGNCDGVGHERRLPLPGDQSPHTVGLPSELRGAVHRKAMNFSGRMSEVYRDVGDRCSAGLRNEKFPRRLLSG